MQSVNQDSKTGRFLPGNNANPNGRPKKLTLKEAIRNRNDSDIGKLAALAWRKALAGDLSWATFVLNCYPRETEITGGLDVRHFELGQEFTADERRRIYELAAQLEGDGHTG